VVAGKEVGQLWNNDWLRAEFTHSLPVASIVDKETLDKITPVIMFRESRAYLEQDY
jgi:hypothetical protein